MVFYSQEMSSWLLVAGCAVNAEPFLFFVVRPDLNSSSKSLPLWGRCPEGRRGNAAVEGSHYRGFPRPQVVPRVHVGARLRLPPAARAWSLSPRLQVQLFSFPGFLFTAGDRDKESSYT